MYKFFLTLIVSLLILNSVAYSQEYTEEPYASRSSYGVFGGLNLNFHTANFQSFNGVPSCCQGFENGSGIGLVAGLFYNIPFSEDIDLSLRAKFSQLGGQLSRIENILLSDPNGNSIEGQFEHSFDASLSSIGLEPLIEFKLNNEFRIRGGFRVGFLQQTSLNRHDERILSPNTGTFVDEDGNQTRIRNEYSGDIPDASSIEAAVVAGLSYDLPLNESYTLFLVPQIDFNVGLTSFVPDFSWQSNTINAGIGVRYAPRGVVEPKEKLPPPPPPPPPPLPPLPPPPTVPTLDAVINAVSINDNGMESDVSSIKIEEFLLNRTHPLLNYVFFDKNDDKLPTRYKRISDSEKEDFSFRQFYDMKTMDVYYQVLNVVGKRMQVFPQSTLKLVGCNSDETTEKGNIQLSKRRAESVKNYLVNEWGIDSERIETEARNLPSVPSNIRDKDGMEENRRVEMISNITQIFEPMEIRDTIRTSNPPKIRFKPEIYSDIGVKRWKIVTSQQGRELRIFTGTGGIPKFVEWDLVLEDEQQYVPRLDRPLEYKLVVVDKDNKTWESKKQELPVEQMTVQYKIDNVLDDKEFDIFAMIGFPYNKADLEGMNLLIADQAKKRIKGYSTTEITGHSDRIGSPEVNQKLSQQRAYNVANYLDIDLMFAKGIGQKILLYDNDKPEGRFYSRTVIIDVVTPIE